MCLLVRCDRSGLFGPPITTDTFRRRLPMAPRLNIIIGSTRPGRFGPSVANWFDGFAREYGAFEPALVDLADLDLPVYDEPNHPRLRQYAHEHTRRWSASVEAADA